MRILFTGAHPDDFEYYCAGTFAKYFKQGGHEFYVAIGTNGNIGSFRIKDQKVLAETRRQESLDSCAKIGAHLIWMDFNDEYLIDSEEVRNAYIDAFRVARPDVVFTTYRFADYNPDHEINGYMTFIARINATIPLIKTEHEPTVKIPPMFYCAPTGGFWEFKPDYFVDITNEMDIKKEMWDCHKSQGADDWSGDMFGCDPFQGMLHQNGLMGFNIGVKYAEAFQLCKTWPIGSDAPHKLLP